MKLSFLKPISAQIASFTLPSNAVQYTLYRETI